MSEKGIEMRGKRAEYSEGIFRQIKWNMGFKRFLLRGLDKVDLEWGLLCFALNIKRMNKKDIEKLEEIAMAKVVSWGPIQDTVMIIYRNDKNVCWLGTDIR